MKNPFKMKEAFMKIMVVAIIVSTMEAKGLKVMSVRGPDYVEEAKSSRLHCFIGYDGRSEEDIYSVDWYWMPDNYFKSKENQVFKPIPFYRFKSEASEADQKKIWTHEVKGAFSVGDQASTVTSVYLDQMSFSSEGVFICEVVFKEDFSTFSSSKRVAIGRRPKGTPTVEIANKKKRYQEGDRLEISCSSFHGYPSPNITWFINGEKVQAYGLNPKIIKVSSPDSVYNSELVLETYSKLDFPIQSDILSTGNIKIKCLVSLWDLYHKSNEVSVETIGSVPNPKSIKHIEQNEEPGARLSIFPDSSATKISNGMAILIATFLVSVLFV